MSNCRKNLTNGRILLTNNADTELAANYLAVSIFPKARVPFWEHELLAKRW